MAARHRRKVRCKDLPLACWNGEGVRGRKLNLEQLLSQHCVDMCLLSETFLEPDQTFRLANCVCHLTDRQTAAGGTAMIIRRCIVHHLVPVPVQTHLETTAVRHINQHTGENSCGLPLTFPPIDGSGTDRLFRQGIAVPDGGRTLRQTRGLEIAADHKTGEAPTGIRRQKLLTDLRTVHSNHQPI